ncbi:glutamate receptor 2.6 [Quercus suber]|uniref:Glutamate receptor 2.6 n=1 Tax=Quercus suber TaxID=58331 RepID=A0AAW0IWP8_QUESU
MARNVVIPINVGVLDNYTWVGKLGLSCINMALSDFYAYEDYFKTRLVLQTRDSTSGVVEAAAAGPENSTQANFMIDLGAKAQVPIISFSATSPSLTSSRRPYFFRIAQSDSSQVKAISAIVQASAWREVVLIYIDNEYGEGIIPF